MMNKYTFIFSNNLFHADFYNLLNRDIDNPFNNVIFENETIIKLCKNFFNYIETKPQKIDDKIYLNDLNFIYLDSLENFNLLFYKCKLKTPFFIFEDSKFNKDDFLNINNILFIKNISDILIYFKNRNEEENIIYHVYTLCYNENRLLQHFFNHYKTADRIIVYDNMSTDNSVEIIKNNNRECVLFNTYESFNDSIHQSIKNEIWKKSKGIADFVIVQDLDEFLHFPEYPYNFKKGLFELNKQNPSYVICKGYDMACTQKEFENVPTDEPIFNYLNKGIFNKQYCKPNLINPNAIENTNWTVGNHGISPKPFLPETKFNILLLHYKHTGIEFELEKRLHLKNKIEKCYHGFGTEYLFNEKEMYEYIKNFYDNVIDLKNIIFKKQLITGSVIEHEQSHCGLSGGLGNQLFNIFTVLSLSIKYNLEPFFISKTSNTTNYRHNIFKKLKIVDDCDLKNFYKIIETDQTVVLNFDEIPNIKNDILIQGYCQTSIYFDNFRNIILEDYINLSNEDNEMIQNYIDKLRIKYNKKLVAIHVRRKDYLQLGWDLPLKYYIDCVNYFEHEKHEFIIFTDDKEWCKSKFTYTICDINIDYIELFIMSRMDSIIMSNSTFSWWSAYLGNMEKVLCPYPWFKLTIYNKDIYKDEWIKINY